MVTMEIISCKVSERMGHTPDPGQGLICTDTKELFLGDGKVVGGVPTNKLAEPLSQGLDEIGVMDTMESHYVIRDPNLDENHPRAHYLVTSTNNHPMMASESFPDITDGDVGDIAFVY